MSLNDIKTRLINMVDNNKMSITQAYDIYAKKAMTTNNTGIKVKTSELIVDLYNNAFIDTETAFDLLEYVDDAKSYSCNINVVQPVTDYEDVKIHYSND